jgi:hypothetical protein
MDFSVLAQADNGSQAFFWVVVFAVFAAAIVYLWRNAAGREPGHAL